MDTARFSSKPMARKAIISGVVMKKIITFICNHSGVGGVIELEMVS